MASLSRKERRALQKIYGPAKPWTYEKKREARRREAALMRDIVNLLEKHGGNLDSVRKAVMSVTEGDPDLF
jgi:hypothetical protein